MYRNVLLVVHLAALAGWLGGNFTQFFMAPWFAHRGGVEAVAWYEATGRMARRYYNVAGTLLALSGVLLLLHSDGVYRWSSGFVGVGLAVVVVGGLTGVVFFAPDSDRMAADARSGRPARVRRFLLVLCVDSALVLTAVLAMVAKWRV
ncbi:MAG: hypothetical protein WCC60_05690 [Ilumatobacteraceae bacterium]